MEKATTFMNGFLMMEYEPIPEVMKYLLDGPYTENRLYERIQEFVDYFDQFKDHYRYSECKQLLDHLGTKCLEQINGVEDDDTEDEEIDEEDEDEEDEDEEDEDEEDEDDEAEEAEDDETEDEEQFNNRKRSFEQVQYSLRNRKSHKSYNHDLQHNRHVSFGTETDKMNSTKKKQKVNQKQKTKKAVNDASVAAAAAEIEALEAEERAAAAARDAETKRAKAAAAAAKTSKSKKKATKTSKKTAKSATMPVYNTDSESDDDSLNNTKPPSTPNKKKKPPKTGTTPRRKQKTHACSVKQMKDVATSDKFDLVARRTKELQKQGSLASKTEHDKNPKLQFVLMTYDEVITNQNNQSSNINNGRFSFLTCKRFDPKLIGPQLTKIGEEMSKGHKKGTNFECLTKCKSNFVRLFGSKRKYRGKKGKNKQFKENPELHK